METKQAWIIANFRESAVRVFLFLWGDFERRAKMLDRKADENVFQQLQSRYTDHLRSELLKTVEKSLTEYSGNRNTLRRNLTDQVSHNVSSFMLKAKLM